jgi:hypothetical protein
MIYLLFNLGIILKNENYNETLPNKANFRKGFKKSFNSYLFWQADQKGN